MFAAALLCFLFSDSVSLRQLHSFPTRRSSDLIKAGIISPNFIRPFPVADVIEACKNVKALVIGDRSDSYGSDGDRKSTRLNSSHVANSYAVFCLQKKKQQDIRAHGTIQCKPSQ